MSLHVQAPTGLGETAEQQLHGIFDTLDSVIVDVLKMGFPAVERPNFAAPGKLNPKQLDNLTPEDYHLLVAQYSAWKSYAAYQINVFECGILECDNELKVLPAAIRKNMRAMSATKPTKDEMEDEVTTNPRVIELTLMRQKYIETKKLIEPEYKMYSTALQQLSRSLEMRRQELETVHKGDARGRRRPYL